MSLAVCVVWRQPTGYLAACVRALSRQPETSVVVCVEPQGEATSFAEGDLDWGAAIVERIVDGALPAAVRSADAVLFSGWDRRALTAALRRLPCRRIVAFDNPWRGTIRQRAGVALSPILVRGRFDACFVPGWRQADFARRLGFEPERVALGLYAADVSVFAPTPLPCEPSFLFVGQLIDRKGIRELLAGYARYRAVAAPSPWPLRVCGAGPLEREVARVDGVEYLGFAQPETVGRLLRESACFVLPSREEHWGVAAHEAASAGRPLILSDAVTAAEACLEPYGNGLVHRRRDERSIARALASVAALDRATLEQWGARSAELAKRHSPEAWAASLLALIRSLG